MCSGGFTGCSRGTVFLIEGWGGSSYRDGLYKLDDMIILTSYM